VAVPAAPTEAGGGKVIFVSLDDGGANVAAILRGLAAATINTTRHAHLAVATHEEGDTVAAGHPVAAIAGVEGTTVRPVIVDSAGRVISRPGLAYDAGGGENGFAHQRVLAGATLNGEQVGHGAVGTHLQAETFDATDPLVVMGGLVAGAAKAIAVDASGRLLTVPDATLAGTGHKDIASTGVAVALKGSTPCRKVQVKADSGNGAVVYLGISTVTNNETEATAGYQLAAGEEVIWEVANVNTLYINGTAGNGCSFAWWT
jgi:hypothetical protein